MAATAQIFKAPVGMRAANIGGTSDQQVVGVLEDGPDSKLYPLDTAATDATPALEIGDAKFVAIEGMLLSGAGKFEVYDGSDVLQYSFTYPLYVPFARAVPKGWKYKLVAV